MSVDHMRRELRMLAAELDFQLAETERRRQEGDDHERIEAAGELAILRGEKAMLEARLVELRATPQTWPAELWQWLKEAWFNIMFQLEVWMTGHRGRLGHDR